MRFALIALAGLTLASGAHAQVHVKGHIRSDGTYVAPHVRTAPNNSTSDNWSTKPNVNPYTGQEGRANPTPTVPQWKPYTPPQSAQSNTKPRCAKGSLFC